MESTAVVCVTISVPIFQIGFYDTVVLQCPSLCTIVLVRQSQKIDEIQPKLLRFLVQSLVIFLMPSMTATSQ